MTTQMRKNATKALLAGMLAAMLVTGPQASGNGAGTTDPCKGAGPHRILYVPSAFSSAEYPSGGAAYFYQGAQNNGCDYWLVDVKMATYSNEWGDDNPMHVKVAADVYDLPSSSSFGGRLPTTYEDCLRVMIHSRFYLKKSNESHFTKLAVESRKGTWENGKCSIGLPTAWDAHPSSSGWDTYRVAVWVKLRSSGQEAIVRVTQPPAR